MKESFFESTSKGHKHCIELRRMIAPRFFLTTSLLLVSFVPPVHSSCLQCQFVSSDPSDCIVYGAIDGDLLAWTKADADCLAAYNIKIDSIDVNTVGCGSTSSTSAFVNAIRFGTLPNSIRGGLGSGFFVQGTNGLYSLADSITVDGTSYSCEDSESACYTALQTYFASGTGATEMEQVCDTVRNQVAVDRELEQSTVRIQMCQDPTTGSAVCGDLVQEMEERVDVYSNKACSAFGLGPGSIAIPGCDGVSSTTTTTATATGTSSASKMGALIALDTILALGIAGLVY